MHYISSIGSVEGRCAYTISESPLRAMRAMSSSLTHWGMNQMTIFVRDILK